jgi:hypothetical protein
MAFDAHKNLAISTIATAPVPPTSGTSITVAGGEGARFPAVPFQATVWANGAIPTPANAEIVRVTGVNGDGFTITRAQENTTARAIVAGDLIAATITAKTIADIENGTNFPQVAIGSLVLTQDMGQYPVLRTNTIDGADDRVLYVCAGGAIADANRGAWFGIGGNESPTPGVMSINAGNVAAGKINFYTQNTARWTIHPSGGFGPPPDDPGTGNIAFPVGKLLKMGTISIGADFFAMGGFPGESNACIKQGVNGTTTVPIQIFYNSNGAVGGIDMAATSVVYKTTSDARLKTDHGPLTDLDVLRRTRVHAFTWTADGTPGRGVFAQEAITVAPFAVSEGTDERDDAGHLLRPWGVDYAKYVPDLLVGWQHHAAEILALQTTVTTLEDRIAALERRLAALAPDTQ